MPNVTAISGEDLVVRCRYGGYPIKSIRWFANGIVLPLHPRQKVSQGGTLSIQSVQQEADEGSTAAWSAEWTDTRLLVQPLCPLLVRDMECFFVSGLVVCCC
ncbi:down syndrome cell adhesion molecule-like protein Dscam2 [Caerostris extrusa]|uniref:Down syndrome cell adhesion molecule-like protein Dscam2 n=1 Tax=Caerostris extrusa TaxID=172846 RepID=A0AAV4XP77_CAEEX|nr:down syndrome cell adhesion molecule-like protein Dscam2 [Caerostris extrusa]